MPEPQAPNSVSVGWTTRGGIVVILLGLVPLLVKTIEEGRVALGQPEKWLAIGSVVAIFVVGLGRYIQAAILSKG
jgi:hypothetical protein